MKKQRLEGNILPKAKQRFIVDGFTSTDILYLTRDVIEMTLGVIELPDQTRVPGGRVRAGEFTMTLQFARDIDRNMYITWFEYCVDGGPPSGGIGINTNQIAGNVREEVDGINPIYKKNATIIYNRLYKGGAVTKNLVTARLEGCWPSSLKLPDYDMNGDESDGDCTLEVTMSFDDVRIDITGDPAPVA